ncbi:pPIWI_RE_Z domain-containing protein [Streptomyces sp. GSL17-111]|uniref:pPIWI_RE_Z domain-containing protein n=1 Tax=Streptomyces sp. GSL17-111 TaxID=3121596 RepID=UPI0030F37E67
MRDRSSWYRPVVEALRPWPEAHDDTRPSLLCQVELGLRLLETLDPRCGADGVWTLLGGYPFGQAAGLVRSDSQHLAVAAARHLLWPMRRRRMWEQALETYLELPERLRGYRVPTTGGPARRVDPPIAGARFTVYDAALATLPDFATSSLPLAGTGSYRFMDGRRHASVSIPESLVREPTAGHDLAAGRPGDSTPIDVSMDELADTAEWMDAEEQRLGLRAGNWAERLTDLHLDTRSPGGSDFVPASRLRLDELTHLVGMVGAGKSTLMSLLAVWAHQRGLRTTLVVGDVAEQIALTELFRGLGLSAAVVQGGTTREQHTQRLHRRLAARGARSLLLHTDRAFDHLSTTCPLDALRGLDAAAPLRYADAPCGALHPVRHTAPPEEPSGPDDRLEHLRALRRTESPPSDRPSEAPDELRDAHTCPLWSSCPRHFAARSLVDALIWVANPASLVQTAVPRQLSAERLRYLELACLRSDIVIVDEADRVQMQLDQMFAPSATLVTRGPESWLDQLQTHEIAELARQGRLPLSDRDVERWSSALDVVGQATDRLYARLIKNEDLRSWAQIDYFSAWTLQERLLHEWYPPLAAPTEETLENEAELYEGEGGLRAARTSGEEPDGQRLSPAGDPHAERREVVTRVLDAFRDDPLGDRGPYGTDTDALTRLAHDLLHTLDEKSTRRRVRTVLEVLLKEAPCVKEGSASGDKWLEQAAERLEFVIILAVLHQRLDRVTFLWPQVEAALHLDTGGNDLTRRPPLDYAPLVPETPMGNVLGFQYLPDDRERRRDSEGRCTGTLRFFRCAGVGRELLLSLHRLGAQPEHGRGGPQVLLMSGTSWAGTSTRAHVLAPVRAVLRPGTKALRAISETHFRTHFLYDTAGRPIRLSGQHPDRRADVLRSMVLGLARDGRGGEPGPLRQELGRIADERRRRALLLVGSYREATVAAHLLDEIPRWHGRVRVLTADDAELDAAVAGDPARGDGRGRAGAVRRGDLATFADDPDAELLVAPLLAIERGHNILTVPQRPGEERVAAFGTVFFLARPHPRPDDLSLTVFAVNDWAARFVRDQHRDSRSGQQGGFTELVSAAPDLNQAGATFRTTARGVWRHLLSRPYVYSALSESEKESFAWDQLVTIWQVIGRLVRGGVPARVVFVDAAFAPALAAAWAPRPLVEPPRWLRDPGLLVRLRDVLAPYFDQGADPCTFTDPTDPALVRKLYQPLYQALCRLGTDD